MCALARCFACGQEDASGSGDLGQRQLGRGESLGRGDFSPVSKNYRWALVGDLFSNAMNQGQDNIKC
jgi:hypothetical protein